MGLPLSKRITLVTGAGSGIGRSIAIKLASMGATIVATDIRPEAAQETVNMLSLQQFPHTARTLDVTNKEDVQRTAKEIVNQYGLLDILVNNAGVSTMQTIEKLTEKEWDFNFDVNIKGVFFCTQAVIPYMKIQNSGKIINTASMAGTRGVPLLSHYAASKWGVIGFTKSAAMELAPFGINVNCVCPGYVKTTMQERELLWEAELRGMTPEEVKEEYIRNTPLGRLCTAEDVAKAVGFLASPESDFITGEAMNVTGGADLV